MPLAAWLGIVGLALTMLVQFAGIIWFAATQKQIVSGLTQMVSELREIVRALDKNQTSMDKRVALLEQARLS